MGGSGGALGELWEALAELKEALGELRMLFFCTKKALVGMLLLGNVFFRYKKTCGHVTAQQFYCLGTKKPLRACYCSTILSLRYEKAPAGMLLLRKTIFEVRKETLRACYRSEI